jgi:hypothetical protein
MKIRKIHKKKFVVEKREEQINLILNEIVLLLVIRSCYEYQDHTNYINYIFFIMDKMYPTMEEITCL